MKEENARVNARNDALTERCNELTAEVLRQRKAIAQLTTEKDRAERTLADTRTDARAKTTSWKSACEEARSELRGTCWDTDISGFCPLCEVTQ